MSNERQELLLDLLSTKAVYGLSDEEQRQLDSLEEVTADDELLLLEMTAAAINMGGLDEHEPMPAHLYSKIQSDADQFFASAQPARFEESPAVEEQRHIELTPSETPRGSSWFGWLGWAAAAAACVALAVNIWVGRPEREIANQTPPQAQTPAPLTPAQRREEMMASSPEVLKANWAAGNVKELKQISGDVVWSDEKQAGFMRFRGLPVNDKQKETYQLWIFDKTQDKATPIDGGTFDVTADGEVVIPIDAKLKAQDPTMFAITVEKPGGVVVSKREKIVALAQVETGTG